LAESFSLCSSMLVVRSQVPDIFLEPASARVPLELPEQFPEWGVELSETERHRVLIRLLC
jgi:hypothetical protein